MADTTPGVDIVELVRQAVSRGDRDGVATYIARHPLELWFGLHPSDLQTVLDAANAEHLWSSPIGPLVLSVYHPDRADQRAAAIRLSNRAPHDLRRRDAETLAQAFQLRLEGDPVAALRLARTLGPVRRPVSPLVDSSRGQRAFITLQVGITALIAGRLREALAFLEKSLVFPVPRSLIFFHRDAHLRIALIHALYGSQAQARSRLEAAQQVPRTASWAEAVLDTDEQLVRTLLRPASEADAAFEAVCATPIARMQELWPVYVAATQKLGLVAGQGKLLRARIEQIGTVGLAAAAGTGLTGSAIGHVEAMQSLLAGASSQSQKLLAATDQDLWQTKLIAAMHALTRGGAELAASLARAVAHETAGLQQAENQRLMILALAHDLDGDPAATVAALTELSPTIDPYTDVLLQALSPRVAALAAETIPAWPPTADPLPSLGVLDRRSLTERELEVLQAIARGWSRDAVARELFITVNTVKTHQRSLYRKLGATTKDGAIREAQRRALL